MNCYMAGWFALVSRKLFPQPAHYESYAQLAEQVIKATLTEHKLSAETFAQVRAKFNRHLTPRGVDFHTTIRVDLLKKN
jgi:hypothetical protein